MEKDRKYLKLAGELLILAVVVGGLAFVFARLHAAPEGDRGTALSELYPAPTELYPIQDNPSGAEDIESYPPPEPDPYQAYPEPGGPPLPTRTPRPTPTDIIPPTPEPPPDWPADQPWPPVITPTTPTPTVPPESFPTPAFPPTPEGKRPDDLQQIWFAYAPKPDSQPELWAVELDEKLQRWGTLKLPFDLKVPRPKPGYEPGGLMNLHISPDFRWLVADYAYRGSQLVDISTGSNKKDAMPEPWLFFDWVQDGQGMLGLSGGNFHTFDLMSFTNKTFELLESGGEPPLGTWHAIAYAPDGERLASANLQGGALVDISLWDAGSGLRESLV